MLVLVWLCKTKIWWKSKILLYGYRHIWNIWVYMKIFHMKVFQLYMNIDDIYTDIAKEVETKFDTSNSELDRPLPKGKEKRQLD